MIDADQPPHVRFDLRREREPFSGEPVFSELAVEIELVHQVAVANAFERQRYGAIGPHFNEAAAWLIGEPDLDAVQFASSDEIDHAARSGGAKKLEGT